MKKRLLSILVAVTIASGMVSGLAAKAGIPSDMVAKVAAANSSVTLTKGENALKNLRMRLIVTFRVSGSGVTYTVSGGTAAGGSGSAPEGTFDLRLSAENGFAAGKTHTLMFYNADGTRLASYTFKVS